jgi:hypothetical protein
MKNKDETPNVYVKTLVEICRDEQQLHLGASKVRKILNTHKSHSSIIAGFGTPLKPFPCRLPHKNKTRTCTTEEAFV